jgi:hypothetical protein
MSKKQQRFSEFVVTNIVYQFSEKYESQKIKSFSILTTSKNALTRKVGLGMGYGLYYTKC